MLKESGAMVTSVVDGVGISELKAVLEDEQLYDSILELKRSRFRSDNEDDDEEQR